MRVEDGEEARPGIFAMKQIRAYALQSEADLARIALEGADIPAVAASPADRPRTAATGPGR